MNALLELAAKVQSLNVGLKSHVKRTKAQRLEILVGLWNEMATRNDLNFNSSCLKALRQNSWLETSVGGELWRPSGIVATVLPAVGALELFVMNVSSAIAHGNAILVKPSTRSSAAELNFFRWSCEHLQGLATLVELKNEDLEFLMQHPAIKKHNIYGSQKTIEALPRPKKMRSSRARLNVGIALDDFALDVGQIAEICLNWRMNPDNRIQWLWVQENVWPKITAALQDFKSEQEAIDARWQMVLKSLHAQSLKEGAKHLKEQIFYDLNSCSTLYQEEVLGPYVQLTKFKYIHEVNKQLQNHENLCVSMWTRDPGKALRWAESSKCTEFYLNPTAQTLQTQKWRREIKDLSAFYRDLTEVTIAWND